MENLAPVMRVIIYVIAFFLGASIFSFLEVMIIRIPQKRSFISGHSVCDSCGHELGALDMIPVFGWVLLGGRCRYCKTKFPPTSSVKEAVGGAILCFCLLRFGLTVQAFSTFISICAMNVAAFIALSQKKIHIPSAVTAAVLTAASFVASIILSAEKGICAVTAAAVVCAAATAGGVAFIVSRKKNAVGVTATVVCAVLACGMFLIK